jgi:hypothetical protein
MSLMFSTISGLLGLVVAIAGIAISAMHVGKVKGAGLLLAGFSLEAFAGLIFRLASFAVTGSLGPSLMPAYALGSLISVAGAAVVVAGVYTVLTSAAAASRR